MRKLSDRCLGLGHCVSILENTKREDNHFCRGEFARHSCYRQAAVLIASMKRDCLKIRGFDLGLYWFVLVPMIPQRNSMRRTAPKIHEAPGLIDADVAKRMNPS